MRRKKRFIYYYNHHHCSSLLSNHILLDSIINCHNCINSDVHQNVFSIDNDDDVDDCLPIECQKYDVSNLKKTTYSSFMTDNVHISVHSVYISALMSDLVVRHYFYCCCCYYLFDHLLILCLKWFCSQILNTITIIIINVLLLLIHYFEIYHQNH